MIYLDNNATTAIDPCVAKRVSTLLEQGPLNASSVHQKGQLARALLLEASSQVAGFFDVDEDQLLFTSGATEAIGCALTSAAVGAPAHLISSSIEHAAVLGWLDHLKTRGWKITLLDPLPGEGAILPWQVEAALRPDTKLLCLMAANNETGCKTDLFKMAAIAKRFALHFVVDGVAQLGKERIELLDGISAICFSGHKIHGPHGSGLLLHAKDFSLAPLIWGGAQQRGLRGGTENLLAIVGFAEAVRALDGKLEEFQERMQLLRDSFEKEIQTAFPTVLINGAKNRVSNTSNLFFPGLDGETLLQSLDLMGVAASHGAACSSAALGLSHVLEKMRGRREARSCLRFSLSRFTTQEEIKQAVAALSSVLSSLLAMTA